MASTLHGCSTCHYFGTGCHRQADLNPGQACPRYEDRCHWLARQIELIRQAESTTRRLLAASLAAIALPLALWVLVQGGLDTAAQPRLAVAASAAAPTIR